VGDTAGEWPTYFVAFVISRESFDLGAQWIRLRSPQRSAALRNSKAWPSAGRKIKGAQPLSEKLKSKSGPFKKRRAPASGDSRASPPALVQRVARQRCRLPHPAPRQPRRRMALLPGRPRRLRHRSRPIHPNHRRPLQILCYMTTRTRCLRRHPASPELAEGNPSARFAEGVRDLL
jgi:hypothetical protein